MTYQVSRRYMRKKAAQAEQPVNLLLSYFNEQCHTVLETCLVSSPHLVGGGFTLQITELVEDDSLFLGQRLLKRDSGLFLE